MRKHFLGEPVVLALRQEETNHLRLWLSVVSNEFLALLRFFGIQCCLSREGASVGSDTSESFFHILLWQD